MTMPTLSNSDKIMRFSIVIPTYQRRDVVVSSVQALAHQEFDGNFEVIVVVDGSNDGSGEALKQLTLPVPLTVIEQVNQGRATAINNGVAVAKGELLLFLDDDMEAHPHLLKEHDLSHQQGADIVIGHIPLHPDSPQNFLSEVVKIWADERLELLSQPNAQLTLHDLITGQASIPREIFNCLGGFNVNFNRNGFFGNEDLDFCYRLRQKGYQAVFNPRAISWQKYIVTPRQYLRQYYQAGRADVLFARLHPEETETMFHRPETMMDRWVWRWFRGLIRGFVLTALELGSQRNFLVQIFCWLVNLEYYQGVRESGGIPQPRPLRILCYHAIADLKKAPILESYGVPPEIFAQQMDQLSKSGYRFIDADEFLRFLQGKGGLPKKAVLISFDDCYQDVLDFALPILQERGIPAVAFAVSKRLGGTNEWDQRIGAPIMQLMDVEGLKKLAQGCFEIGAHSQTHPQLTQISQEQLVDEMAGSIADLEKVGLTRPRLFAYPHGVYDENVEKLAQEIGLEAAFTVEPDWVKPGVKPYQIPRFEIFREDTGWKFHWKVLTAGRSWKKMLFSDS
jgi:peptidoglycan/xylan/chitin deacetylase (PgdA/CDA1 family)/GT2 family glycosyltransferase